MFNRSGGSSSFTHVSKVLLNNLPKVILSNKGLIEFYNNKKRFEGWLKVEVINCLKIAFPENKIEPEVSKFDILFNNSFIELKILLTEYDFINNFKSKKRNNKKNIYRLIKDFKKLKSASIKNKIVLFLVFPLNNHNIKQWEDLLWSLLESNDINLADVEYKKSQKVLFNNKGEGRLYLFKIK